MSDWSDKLARERRETQEKEHVNNELRLSNRRKVEQNAESQWQAVRKRINELADELNASWGGNAINAVNVTSSPFQLVIAL
jgi:hypothetical protein